jgi:hypothetical protein
MLERRGDRGRACADARGATVSRLLALLAAFLACGTPVVAVLWSAVNEVAAGDVGRLAVALPMLLLLLAVLVLFGRQIRRLDSRS